MSLEAAKTLVAQAARPRSLADMFPVNKDNPPVARLVIKNRPGRLKIRL